MLSRRPVLGGISEHREEEAVSVSIIAWTLRWRGGSVCGRAQRRARSDLIGLLRAIVSLKWEMIYQKGGMKAAVVLE